MVGFCRQVLTFWSWRVSVWLAAKTGGMGRARLRGTLGLVESIKSLGKLPGKIDWRNFRRVLLI